MSAVPGRPTRGAWHGLLVSVRDAEEARAALAGGAAIIDVKEPAGGALGAAPVASVAEIAAVVGDARPLTLACGELREGAAAVVRHVQRVVAALTTGPQLAAVKAGPADLDIARWRRAFGDMQAGLPPGVEAVAVAYADWQDCAAPTPEALIAAAPRAGARTLLIDTCGKRPPGVFARQAADVAHWIGLARSAGLRVAIAGGIEESQLAAAVVAGADVVAVRSAACDEGRLGRVSRTRVAVLARTFAAAGRLLPSVIPAAGRGCTATAGEQP